MSFASSVADERKAGDKDKEDQSRELRGLFGRGGRFMDERDRPHERSERDRKLQLRRFDKDSPSDNSTLSSPSKLDNTNARTGASGRGAGTPSDSSRARPSSSATNDRDWRTARPPLAAPGRGVGRGMTDRQGGGVGGGPGGLSDSTGVPSEDVAGGTGLGGFGTGKKPEWMDTDNDVSGTTGSTGSRGDEMDDLQKFKAMMKAREARGDTLTTMGERKEDEYIPGSDIGRQAELTLPTPATDSQLPTVSAAKLTSPAALVGLPPDPPIAAGSAKATSSEPLSAGPEKASRFAKFFVAGRDDVTTSAGGPANPIAGVAATKSVEVLGLTSGVGAPLVAAARSASDGSGMSMLNGSGNNFAGMRRTPDSMQTLPERFLGRSTDILSPPLASANGFVANSLSAAGNLSVPPQQQQPAPLPPNLTAPYHSGPPHLMNPNPAKRPILEQELLQALGVRQKSSVPLSGIAPATAVAGSTLTGSGVAGVASGDDFKRVMSMLTNAKPARQQSPQQGQPVLGGGLPVPPQQQPGYPYPVMVERSPNYNGRSGLGAGVGQASAVPRSEVPMHAGVSRPTAGGSEGNSVAAQYLTGLLQQGIAAGRGAALDMGRRQQFAAEIVRGGDDFRDIGIAQADPFYRQDGRGARPTQGTFGAYGPNNTGLNMVSGVNSGIPANASGNLPRGSYEEYVLAQHRAAARQNALDAGGLSPRYYGGPSPMGPVYGGQYAPRFPDPSGAPLPSQQLPTGGYGVRMDPNALQGGVRPGGIMPVYGDVVYQGATGVEFMGAGTPRDGQRLPHQIRGRGM
ncbi:hypothetical protein HDU93_004124 [Gonapodya sp. JEL0774]|nr:hypothetical protein HDU93_004124 [Gonapodya sp. JEL0774]